jgi:hypothetical protein
LTVSLLEIFAAARSHAAPLAAESAGYLLLAVADHVVAAPRGVLADDVELASDGSVRLRRPGSLGQQVPELALRHLLRRALTVASSVGPGLRRAAERREETGLTALVRELEVALIPVNRGAAKRALSRLHRETERARDAGKLAALLIAEAALDEPLPVVVSPAPAPESVVVVPAPAPVVVVVAPAPSVPVEVSEPPPPVSLPNVVAARTPAARPAPVVELTLTPEPRSAEPEPALTKPEPVVLRAKERGSSTPRLGTVVTAQTLVGEESDLTERAPELALADEAALDLPIEVEVDVEEAVVEAQAGEADDAETPVRSQAASPQLLVDPEPSRMPDVFTAMRQLHSSMQSEQTNMPVDDETPTRLREVVTELLALVQSVPAITPEPQQVDDSWLTQSSLEEVVTSVRLFESERVDPQLHEAATWDPGPVVTASAASSVSPLPPALLIAAPAPEPSPYAPAVLPAPSSDVSELVDSFYVSGGSEEGELRSALKEMAGLELTPLPHPLIEER